MPEIGDTELLEVDVYPWDNTTAAYFTVIHPDNTSTNHPAAPTEIQADVEVDGVMQTVTAQRWTSGNLIYDQSRQWVIVGIVTGTGAGVQSKTVWVDELPAAGGVAWRPNLQRVADYVPHRTVPEAFESAGEPVNTFTDSTAPPAATVDRIIDGAVTWVLTSTGDLHASLLPAAQEAASLRAAGFVELAGRPSVDQQLAQTLLAQADAALKALQARNTNLTGEDPDDPDGVFEVAPAYRFPPAPCDGYIFWIC